MIQLFSILCVIIAAVLGWIVYTNDRNATANKYYGAFSLASSFWLFCNLVTTPGPIDFTDEVIQFFGSLISLSSVVSLILLIYFSYNFISRKLPLAFRVYFIFQIVFLSAISFTSLNVSAVDGELTVGALYPLVVFFQVTNFVIILLPLYSTGQETEIEKKRRKFLRRSILASLLPIFILGSVVPLFGYENVSNIAPAFSIVFLVIFARAILARELFDIRETVARATAYVLSLSTLVAIYLSLLFGVSQAFSTTTATDWRVRLFYLAIAILSALSFQPIKRFFDKVTSQVFFRDAYDPQQLIDEISNQLVTHYELDKLGDSVAAVIVKYLKVDFCSFYVSESAKQHLFGTKKDITFMKADDITRGMTANIMLIDEHHENHHNIEKSLKRDIEKTGAKMVVKLESTSVNIGAMFIGPKKSGSSFSQNDIRVIDILSDELALAFQNATRFEQISTFNATLQQKIEAATQELTRTNHKLQALDEAKDEFISMASHQLRTPLTSIKGYLSLVLDGDIGEITPQQRQLLGQAFTSSQRMVYLIADLLNVSRLRTGKFIIEPTEVQLANVVSEEMKQIEEAAKAKKQKLIYKKPKSFPALQLDDNKIRQVMMNFMDNAIYYTPNGGEIKIELIKKRSSIEFRVTDNGIGVPKPEQHKLFTKFYRAGNARSVRPDGTGLGLFMAKKVIVASGGALLFKSTEGKGSMFGFTFPLNKRKTGT
jgi:signal transduction histidine kinase